MRLNLEKPSGNQIKSYAPGMLEIGEKEFKSSVLVSVDWLQDWAVESLQHLQAEHWQQIVSRRPGLVILGTGPELSFPPAKDMSPLTDAKIGVEVMNTAAACRTFNVLVSEGRDVLAALIV